MKKLDYKELMLHFDALGLRLELMEDKLEKLAVYNRSLMALNHKLAKQIKEQEGVRAQTI